MEYIFYIIIKKSLLNKIVYQCFFSHKVFIFVMTDGKKKAQNNFQSPLHVHKLNENGRQIIIEQPLNPGIIRV